MTRIFHSSLSAHGVLFAGDFPTMTDACATTHLVSMTSSFSCRPSMRSTIAAQQQRQLKHRSRQLQLPPMELARPRRASSAASITQAPWQAQQLLCRRQWPASPAWLPAPWQQQQPSSNSSTSPDLASVPEKSQLGEQPQQASGAKSTEPGLSSTCTLSSGFVTKVMSPSWLDILEVLLIRDTLHVAPSMIISMLDYGMGVCAHAHDLV